MGSLAPTISDALRGGDLAAPIAACLRAHADRPAVVDGGRVSTYAELDEDIGRICGLLVGAGCGRGSRIGMAMRHGTALVSSVLAALRLGATYVPVDTRNPGDRNRWIIGDSGCTHIAYTRDNAAFARSVGATAVDVEGPADPRHAGLAPVDVPVGPEDLAYILYTSGSTGSPKGVGITRRNLANYVAWASEAYFRSPSDRIALYTTLAFDFTVTCIIPPLVVGASIGIFDGISNPMAIRDILQDRAVTVVKITPAYLSILAEMLDGPSGLVRLIVGGEDLSVSLARKVTEGTGGSVEIINEYGPTEATVGCICHIYDPEADVGASVPIGRPIPGMGAALIDESGDAVDDGSAGELVLFGRSVAPGYVGTNRSQQSNFGLLGPPGSGISYRTGDIARRDASGALRFLGRRDDQVKIRGNRVELAEVVSEMGKAPGVLSAYATAVPDEASHTLVALATCEASVRPRDILEHLRAKLPSYMVPTRLRIVPNLPLTPHQKVDREAAIALLADAGDHR